MATQKTLKIVAVLFMYTVFISFLYNKKSNTLQHIDSLLNGRPNGLMLLVPSANSDSKKSIFPRTLQPNRSDTLRYIVSGSGLNCEENPAMVVRDARRMEQSMSSLPVRNLSKSAKTLKFAYAWYATENDYLCSALAAMSHLKHIRDHASVPKRNKTSITYSVDYILIYATEDYSQHGSRLSKSLFQRWEILGGKIRRFKGLGHHLHDIYYKYSLQKFNAFLLTDYDRVVVMDADGLAASNLDHLFFLPLNNRVPIAAPQGYWFQDQGFSIAKHGENCFGAANELHPYVVVTSVLLTFIPSQDLFDRVEKHFGKWKSNRIESHYGKQKPRQLYDMDILNMEFACNKEILVLPKMYGTLNSEYMRGLKLYGQMSACRSFNSVRFLHFSGYGKPWERASQPRRMLDYIQMHSDDVRPIVYDWFRQAHDSCPWLVGRLPAKLPRW